MNQLEMDLRTVIAALEPLGNAWNEHVTKRSVSLLPPARPEEIQAREEFWKTPFSPSYRAFLQIHNGWFGCEKWDIFGVSGPGFDELYSRYIDDMSFFEGEYKKRGGAKYVNRLKKNETKKDDVLYLPNHVPCAIGPERYYLAFDRNRRDDNGEYAIALVGTGDNVHGRYSSFFQFISGRITELEGKLRKRGVNPEEIVAAARARVS